MITAEMWKRLEKRDFDECGMRPNHARRRVNISQARFLELVNAGLTPKEIAGRSGMTDGAAYAAVMRLKAKAAKHGR